MTWPRPVRGRLVGTLLALGGVVSAAPTMVWPSNTITLTPTADQVAQGAEAQRMAFWSWGRVADATLGTTDPIIDFGSPWGLLLVGVALLAGVLAAAGHAFRRGSDGLLLGVAGTAWLSATLAAGVGQTAGRMQSYFGFVEGLTAETTVAGALQLVAVALLLAALATMVRRPVMTLVSLASKARPAWARRGSVLAVRRGSDKDGAAPSTGGTDAGAEGASAGPAAPPPPPPTLRVGIATIRDVEPGAQAGWGGRAVGRSPGARGWAEGRAGVGFSDDDRREAPPMPAPASDSERFRPPR